MKNSIFYALDDKFFKEFYSQMRHQCRNQLNNLKEVQSIANPNDLDHPLWIRLGDQLMRGTSIDQAYGQFYNQFKKDFGK